MANPGLTEEEMYSSLSESRRNVQFRPLTQA